MTSKTAPISDANDLVRLDRVGDLAFLIIDNAPVNALSRDLRQALINRVEHLKSDATVCAIVLTGANDTFIAGADIREFGQPLSDPTLPDVVSAIENCPKPVIAAIQGAALGGGYEIALACDCRIAAPDAVLGLPEGTFGIIPGAGGTVRLPRLIDPATALELVSTCRRVKAKEALELGMVDLVAADLREAAAKLASTATKRRLRDLPSKSTEPELFEKAAQAALRRGRGRPYAQEQVDALRRAVSSTFDVALDAERSAFQRLRESDESKALRYLFFAERDAGRFEELRGVTALPVRSVGVVGAGTMGSGIAASFLGSGIPVIIVDSSEGALDAAADRIQGFLAKAPKTAELTRSLDLQALASCDLVIEAVFEDLTIKQKLLKELDAIVRSDCILASNTSYLDLDAMAAATKLPERVVGLHFFAPAHIMKLLEIVRGNRTSPSVLATALQLGRTLRKVAVVSGVGDGFIGNRIYNAYRTECEAMLLAGALPHEVDTAIEDLGFAMGPFSVSDLSGLDIAWANRRRKQATSGDSTSDLPVLEWLFERGRLGRKSGAGWYAYDESGKRAPDPAVTALVEQARRDRGANPRTVSADEIQRRALAAIVNEALLVLQEGVAQRPSDVDLVLINGYGFPRHLGGPLHWANGKGRIELERDLDDLAGIQTGARRRGDLNLLG